METINIKDKDLKNISAYKVAGCGLDLEIKNDYENLQGIITSWTLNIFGEALYTGDTFEKLVTTLQTLITKYDLHEYTENKKDILVIYIDNIYKIQGFFEDYITENFTHYIQVLNFIEFRDMSNWNKDLHSATEIAKYADFLVKNVFVPEKYFYQTPNQRPRKKLLNKLRDLKDDTVKNIFPDNFLWRYIRAGLFGGLGYCPYPGHIFDDPMIEIDLDSAYIFDFLIKQHAMTKLKRVDAKDWEKYLKSSDKTSIGEYKIRFYCDTCKVNCYKDIFGEKILLDTENDTEFIFNNIDLAIFLSLVDVKSIECLSLYESDFGYLPQAVRDQLVEEYVKKEELKKTLGSDAIETKLQKVTVNGIYGDAIRKYLDTWTLKKAKDKAALAPQWGIWTTSYCKLYLLKLALTLDGWRYSATDSIYCKDTPENRAKIEEFNQYIQKEVKEFCNKFGYDYEKLKNLGTFQIKNEISKFKAITQNVYMYTSITDGKIHLKASGSSKTTVELDDSLYDLDKIPVGERTFGFINNKSYFEITLKDESAEVVTEYIVKKRAIRDMNKKNKDR